MAEASKDAEAATVPCPNCGADSVQAYCPVCGQRQRAALLPVRLWLGDAAEFVTDLDNRAARSLRLLFSAPGLLAADYANGRIVAQTPPLRLFLVVSAVAIALMASTGYFEFLAQAYRLDAQAAADFQLLFPAINLLSPVLLALAMKLAWPRTLLHLHLVTALHATTFIVIVSLPMVFLLDRPAWLAWVQVANLVVVAGWLLLGFRRIHGSSWWRCALAALLVTMTWIASATLLQTVAVAVLR